MEYDENNPPIYKKVAPFRLVERYDHCFKTYAKQRWLKKNLLNALEMEFKAYNREYYVFSIYY
jgi:hypothetical protein